jgi:cytochrome bd ubiquinol oxidase subunit II
METLWFFIVAVMVAVYVVLDGFDFGAGILSLFVAKTDEERRSILAAIGPYWDGNEVWLLAGGGALFFAFPKAYAAGFSGFYLPLVMVLWLLMIRNLSIEFRSKEASNVWRSLWDGGLFISSALMAIVLGAALGNVVRGVPLNAEGYFSGPLFTNFMPDAHPGVLDWFTVTIGVFALVVLMLQGALFLRWRLDGPVRDRATAAAKNLWPAVIAVGVLATLAVQLVRPELFGAIFGRPVSLLLTLVFICSFVGVRATLGNKNELLPFVANSLFIATMLAATAVGAYPTLLHSTLDPVNDINAYNAHTSAYSMSIGAVIWVVAIIPVLGYFTYLFRSFAGKVSKGDLIGH